MAGYTKLFSSIVASTIWRESKETKIVWITLLAMANADGRVDASVPGLADMARVTVDECVAAIGVLSAPDSWSRSKEFDGRRIEAIPGGFRVLNYAKYRESRDPEIRREQNREAQARFREKMKEVSQSKPEVSRDKPRSAKAEAEAEAEAEISDPHIPEQVSMDSCKPASVLTDLQTRAGRLFRRRIDTVWGKSEIKAWHAALAAIKATSEAEWLLLEWFYGRPASEKTYRRRSLATLLNNWTAEIDRAREYQAQQDTGANGEQLAPDQLARANAF